jgi:hypothetical protein
MLGGDAMEILLEAGAEARRSGGALRLLHADKASVNTQNRPSMDT